MANIGFLLTGLSLEEVRFVEHHTAQVCIPKAGSRTNNEYISLRSAIVSGTEVCRLPSIRSNRHWIEWDS
jgi:hypothetical protein